MAQSRLTIAQQLELSRRANFSETVRVLIRCGSGLAALYLSQYPIRAVGEMVSDLAGKKTEIIGLAAVITALLGGIVGLAGGYHLGHSHGRQLSEAEQGDET